MQVSCDVLCRMDVDFIDIAVNVSCSPAPPSTRIRLKVCRNYVLIPSCSHSVFTFLYCLTFLYSLITFLILLL